jgi:hypothetical protein
MSAVNVRLDMYLPPTTLCKGYQYEKTATAAAAQLASLADGRSVAGVTATCADVPVIAISGRRLQQGVTQPKITIVIVFNTPAEGSTSYQDVAGQIKSILQEKAIAVSQACQ